MNVPNFLTATRILLIPVFVAGLIGPMAVGPRFAAMVFLVASLTDLFDGYIARRRSQVTIIGRLLDPVADKLLVMAALFVLVEMHRVTSWIAILIVGRELAVMALRALAASKGLILSADVTGKYKLILQIIAIIFLLLQEEPIQFINLQLVGTLCLYTSLALAFASAIQYFMQFWRHIAHTPE